MVTEKQELLQKVVDLKLTKSRVELDLGMPTNSLSAMCKGKKQLPDKYVEPLKRYLTEMALGHLAFNTNAIPVIPENEKPELDENGLPKSLSLTFTAAVDSPEFKKVGQDFAKDLLSKVECVPITPKSFDSPMMNGPFFDEFPQYKTEEPLRDGITNPLTGVFTNYPEDVGTSEMIDSFLKSEGITPEQLIEGYKMLMMANERGLPMDIVKEILDGWLPTNKKVNSGGFRPLSANNEPASTNTPQGLSQAALDIRKKKLGY